MYKIKEIIKKKNKNRIKPRIQQFDMIASDTIYCKVVKTKNKCSHVIKKMKKVNKIVKELACIWMYVLGNKFIWTTTHIFL